MRRGGERKEVGRGGEGLVRQHICQGFCKTDLEVVFFNMGAGGVAKTLHCAS